ncbi:MAG: DUF3641 domain-containing protein [Coriobacteriales bacterium]|nr:DUF3641 domain-containing protein [Coriobacteriales bacterium]
MSPANDFAMKIASIDRSALSAARVRSLVLNVGLRCTSNCMHCAVDGSPKRTEQMDDRTMQQCVSLAQRLRPDVVEITGGAPELHPGLRALVSTLRAEHLRTRLHTNLAALMSPSSEGLARFLSEAEVEIVGSFPGPSPVGAEKLRGDESYEDALEALWKLNALGYGGRLRLDLVHNPSGTDLPESAELMRRRYRSVLQDHGIAFDDLIVTANVPVGRFERHLRESDSYGDYLLRLKLAFDARTLPMLPCRETIEVGWDGTLWDCDFNLGADLPAFGERRHVSECAPEDLLARQISFGEHCYACTAATGSG